MNWPENFRPIGRIRPNGILKKKTQLADQGILGAEQCRKRIAGLFLAMYVY